MKFIIALFFILLINNALEAFEIPFYIQSQLHEKEYISFIVKGEINKQYFKDRNCRIGTKIKDFTTVQIPEDNLTQILSYPGITIFPAKPDEPLLDQSTSNWMNGNNYVGCNADAAQSSGYDGNGVIIGILDYYPLNWKHEDFNTNGWNSDDLRVLYIWNQQDDSGTHPTGFDYGSEYSKNDLKADNGPVINSGSHGTQCTGIAAGDGSGSGTGSPRMGIASGAEIIYVHKIWNEAGTIDAISYFQDKADELNKPVVISYSGGSRYGFPDGSDAVSQAFDNFCTNGRLASVAGGNYYTTTDHAYSSTTYNNPTTDISFIIDNYVNTGIDSLDDYIDIIFFYKSADNFDVTVTDPGSNNYEITISDDDEIFITDYGKLYIYHHSDSSIEVVVTDYAGTVSANDTWNISLKVPDHSYDDQGGKWSAWIYEKNITGHFTNHNTSNYTLNIYAAGQDCICVAGHSKISGAIYTDSSEGLTMDNRQKPEISAPTYAYTANNSGSNTYSSLGGTSGAAPHVAGTLALMLQRSSNLSPVNARQVLIGNAYTDDQTSAYGQEPNSRFGCGKLNSYGSVLSLHHNYIPNPYHILYKYYHVY